MSKGNTTKTKKKTLILETTQSLILQFGVDKISIREIAKSAGVSQVTIYNHFKDKEKLIDESLKILINKTMEYYENIINSSKSFNEKLIEIFTLRKKLNSQKIWYSLVKISKHDPYIEKIINTLLKEKLKISLFKLIDQGKKENQINQNISEQALVIYIDIFRNYYLESDNALIFSENSVLVRELWDLFWKGIKG